MPSHVVATRWLTAKMLHQLQVLSCDYCHFTKWDSPDHCAPFWRLYWHDRSGGAIEIDGKSLAIQPRDIVLIPPNTHFSSLLKRPFRQLFLHFIVEPRFRRQGNVAYRLSASKELRKGVEDLIAEITLNTSSLRLSFLAQVLLGKALLKLPLDSWTPRFEDRRITLVVERIEKVYPKRVSNVLLARDARLHPQAFIRLFRECTGDTPLHYLVNLRLEEACRMLHQDEAGLDEIAERTGFGDRNYFTRVFSRAMNCSPAKYRRLVNVSNRLRPGA